VERRRRFCRAGVRSFRRLFGSFDGGAAKESQGLLQALAASGDTNAR
jgi:hypothetical protein